MASGMPTALGLQKCQPGRQVICLAGDGGFTMLLGDLLTTVQEDLPIKIVVYDNGKLGFVDIEQKAAGLVPVYTDLKNPDFGEVAKAMGLWGRSVAKAGELEESIQSWLAQPGPALLHVKVKPMQLVMPPSPFVSPDAVVGMGVYTARAMLQGKGHDVWECWWRIFPDQLRKELHSLIGASQAQHLRPRHGLRPLLHIQLGEDVLHVRLHRLRGDGEVPGNLLVGQPLGDQLEYVAFPRTQ
jgi:hypothetical protein